MVKKGSLVVISAPSGTGKTTVIQSFLKKYGTQFNAARVVTYTSRLPRVGEIEGIDYHFVTVQQFEKLIKENFFLEYTCWCDDYYGSPRSIINEVEQGKLFFLIIDREGAKRVHMVYPHAVFVWLMPPSLQELEHRLKVRATDSSEKIKMRIEKAQLELSEEQNDQQLAYPLYQYHIVNNMVEDTVEKIKCIIEKLRKQC